MNLHNSITFGTFKPSTFVPERKSCKSKVEVRLNRVHLESIIHKENGRFVSVDYFKEDGSLRTLTGRLGVKAYLKGGLNTVERADRPYLTMFDIQLLQYRTVNLSTVIAMRCNNIIYTVLD